MFRLVLCGNGKPGYQFARAQNGPADIFIGYAYRVAQEIFEFPTEKVRTLNPCLFHTGEPCFQKQGVLFHNT